MHAPFVEALPHPAEPGWQAAPGTHEPPPGPIGAPPSNDAFMLASTPPPVPLFAGQATPQ